MLTEPVNNPSQAYQRYGMALVRKAERILRNQDDAMDVVQALFVDLLASPPTSLDLPYLYSAVTNRSINMLRNQRNRTRLLEEQSSSLRGPERTPLGSALLSLNLLTRLVEGLDDKSSAILVYHFLDDLNQDEVATQMGISRRAVVKRLAKIRALASQLARAASHNEETSSPDTNPDTNSGERRL